MSDPIEELVSQRRQLVDALVENDVFSIHQSEIEKIREDHECSVSDGPFMVRRWVLVVESQSLSDPDEGFVTVMRRPGTTYSEQIGLLHRGLDV